MYYIATLHPSRLSCEEPIYKIDEDTVFGARRQEAHDLLEGLEVVVEVDDTVDTELDTECYVVDIVAWHTADDEKVCKCHYLLSALSDITHPEFMDFEEYFETWQDDKWVVGSRLQTTIAAIDKGREMAEDEVKAIYKSDEWTVMQD